MKRRQAPEPEVLQLRAFMDRMSVHATLTGRHLNLAPEEALPALVVTALILAEQHECMDHVKRRIAHFLRQSGVMTAEELTRWQ